MEKKFDEVDIEQTRLVSIIKEKEVEIEEDWTLNDMS